ncbi:hypothetical protein M5K25_021219 [Dendrobium thyrsiflorum]|uniref:NB-ARC domain-containing protein n=1 Tax=Dendrobium thyrsiflorum TaxID=117978 RepID=A0ABD0UIU5_DENTH
MMDCRRRSTVDDDRSRRWVVDDDRYPRRWAIDDDRSRIAFYQAQSKASLDRIDNNLRSIDKNLRYMRRMRMPSATIPASSSSLLSSASRNHKQFCNHPAEVDDYPPLELPLRWRDLPLFQDHPPPTRMNRPNDLHAPPVVPNPHILQIHDAFPNDEDDDSFSLGDRAKQESQWHRMKRTDEMVRPNSRWHSSAAVRDQTSSQAGSRLTSCNPNPVSDIPCASRSASSHDTKPTSDQIKSHVVITRSVLVPPMCAPLEPVNPRSVRYQDPLHHLFSTSVDVLTCKSTRMSQQMDGKGEITLAVVTKDDESPEGILEKVRADDVNISETYEEDRAAETNMFKSHHLLFRTDKSIVDIPVSANKLMLIQLPSIANCLPDIVKKINEEMNRNVLVLETVPQNLVIIGVTRRAYISKTIEAALLSEVCNGLHAISIAEIITNDMVVCGKASRSGTRSILIVGVKMSGLNFTDKKDPTRCPQAVRRNVVKGSEHNLKRLKEVVQELDKVPSEVRMKAICVLESVLRKQDDDYCSIIESYFSKDNDDVVKCCELPQASLREKANKVLSLLGGDLHSAPEKEDPTDGKSKAVPTTQLPDLIDTGGLEDDEFGSSSKNLVDEGVGDLTSAPLVDELFGRMGKTTLLQHIYEDEMADEFDLKMWVGVSNNFDVKKIIADMLEFLKMNKPSLDTLYALQKNSKFEMMSKKFLLVLDEEERDKTKWENMLASLSCGSLGSKILVTTRMDSVAEFNILEMLVQFKDSKAEPPHLDWGKPLHVVILKSAFKVFDPGI